MASKFPRSQSNPASMTCWTKVWSMEPPPQNLQDLSVKSVIQCCYIVLFRDMYVDMLKSLLVKLYIWTPIITDKLKRFKEVIFHSPTILRSLLRNNLSAVGRKNSLLTGKSPSWDPRARGEAAIHHDWKSVMEKRREKIEHRDTRQQHKRHFKKLSNHQSSSFMSR